MKTRNVGRDGSYCNIIIIKSLFQAMPIKVRCTIAQESAQIVGARVHVCIITKLRKHTGVAKKVYIYKYKHLNQWFHMAHFCMKVDDIKHVIVMIALLVYQAVHHLGPAYLTSLVTPYAPTRSLRSAAHRSLTIPRYNLERYGRRAFSVAGPSLWNNLPVTIREAGTLTTFKSTLKTHLFRIAFKALC